MEPATSATGASKIMYWAGWVISVLPALLLIFSAIGKLMKAEPVMAGFPKLGWDAELAVPLGIVELVCAILYLIPGTSVLGAILVTGYMGGAIATHVRIGEQFYAPAILGIIVWFGIFLRDARIRALVPWRT
jgi:DoxX-like family